MLSALKKALNTGADSIIVDLEDAVPIELKTSSRHALKEWLITHPEDKFMIRVNSRNTKWFAEDIELAKLDNVSAIILPKTETPEDIEAILSIQDIEIFALIETPLGFANIRQIAKTKSVRAFNVWFN